MTNQQTLRARDFEFGNVGRVLCDKNLDCRHAPPDSGAHSLSRRRTAFRIGSLSRERPLLSTFKRYLAFNLVPLTVAQLQRVDTEVFKESDILMRVFYVVLMLEVVCPTLKALQSYSAVADTYRALL
jgi:hypothetical protein